MVVSSEHHTIDKNLAKNCSYLYEVEVRGSLPNIMVCDSEILLVLKPSLTVGFSFSVSRGARRMGALSESNSTL